jgi:predicted TIM-barrel fold metal-dependent hydrolase
MKKLREGLNNGKKRLLAARSGLHARLAAQYGAIQEGRCKDINGLRYARISHFVPWDRLHYEGEWPHTSKVAQRHPSRLQVLSRLCIYLSHT